VLIVAGIVIDMAVYWGLHHGGLRLGLLAVGAACVLDGLFTATRYR
jgi:hypothetical protein